MLYSPAVNGFPPVSNAQRNFWLGVLNGLLFTLAETLIDPTLVLVAFVSRLTLSPILIGLVAPLRDVGWFLPQLWMSGYIQSLPYKLSIYRPTAVVRALAWAALVLVAVAAPPPGVMLLGFFLAFGTYAVAAGVSGLAFMEVVAKTIAPQRRAVFYAWRLFTGGLAGLGAAAVVRWLLSDSAALTFPRNFGLLFALGWGPAVIGLAAFGLAAFGLVREPPDMQPRPRVSPGQQLRRALTVVRANANYRRFIYVRGSLLIAGAALPFFAVYVREQLGAPLDMVGNYLSVYTIASLLTNVIIGRYAGRLGNRRIILAAALASVLLVGIVTGLVLIVHWQPISGLAAAVWLLPAFALAGVRETCQGVAGQALLLDIAPERDRSLYIGFTNTLLGMVLLSTALSGVVVAALGFPTLLGISLAAGGISVVVGRRIAEPEPAAG